MSYLEQAQKDLRSRSELALRHAALNVRLAIETRAQLFVAMIPPHISLSASEAKKWNAADLVRTFCKHVNYAEHDLTITIQCADTENSVSFSYKQLPPTILADYGRLGNLLHISHKELSPKDLSENRGWLKRLIKDCTPLFRDHVMTPFQWLSGIAPQCEKCSCTMNFHGQRSNKQLIFRCSCGESAAMSNTFVIRLNDQT